MWLGWLAALLPLITTHLSFALSLWEGQIPACFPYWADCVSISRTGRHGHAYWLFKTLMLPASLLLGWFWWQSERWLRAEGLRVSRWLKPLALLASLALVLYTLTLGHANDHFTVARRLGVAGFILCTYLVQVGLGSALYRSPVWRRAGNRVLGLATLILLVALLSVILDLTLQQGYEQWENGFEWWLFLLLNGQMVLILTLWQGGASNGEDRIGTWPR